MIGYYNQIFVRSYIVKWTALYQSDAFIFNIACQLHCSWCTVLMWLCCMSKGVRHSSQWAPLRRLAWPGQLCLAAPACAARNTTHHLIIKTTVIAPMVGDTSATQRCIWCECSEMLCRTSVTPNGKRYSVKFLVLLGFKCSRNKEQRAVQTEKGFYIASSRMPASWNARNETPINRRGWTRYAKIPRE